MSAGLITAIVDEGLGNSSYLVDLGDRRALVIGHGERAMTAASILAAAGHRDLTVVVGGAADWAAASGHPLKTGG